MHPRDRRVHGARTQRRRELSYPSLRLDARRTGGDTRREFLHVRRKNMRRGPHGGRFPGPDGYRETRTNTRTDARSVTPTSPSSATRQTEAGDGDPNRPRTERCSGASVLLMFKVVEAVSLSVLACHAVVRPMTERHPFPVADDITPTASCHIFQFFGYCADLVPWVSVAAVLMARSTAVSQQQRDLTFYRTYNLLVCFFGATAQIIAATIRLVTVRVKFRYLHVAHPALELASALILLADFFFTVLTTSVIVPKRDSRRRASICDKQLLVQVCHMSFGLGLFLTFVLGNPEQPGTHLGMRVKVVLMQNLFPVMFGLLFAATVAHRINEYHGLRHLVIMLNFFAFFCYLMVATVCGFVYAVYEHNKKITLVIIAGVALAAALFSLYFGVTWSLRDTYSQHAKSSALRGTATMLGPGMMARRSRAAEEATSRKKRGGVAREKSGRG